MSPVCFVFHVWNDHELGKRLARQLRQYHPDSDIIAIADGAEADQPGFAEFCQGLGVRYVVGDRLKTRLEGARWTERFMNLYLTHSDAPVLVRLDPDTFVHRPFAYFPPGDYFGQWQNHEAGIHVQGACAGFSRRACTDLIESGLLHDPKYLLGTYHYERYGMYRHPDEAHSTEKVTAEDIVLGDIFSKRLDHLSISNWLEVAGGMLFRGIPPENADLKLAATHPVRYNTPEERANLIGQSLIGSCTNLQLQWIYERATGLCVDVGTFHGRAAAVMAAKGARVAAIDTWNNYTNERGKLVRASEAGAGIEASFRRFGLQAEFVRGDSLVECQRFADGSIDFLFLDSHWAPEFKRAEVVAWLPKVRPGGIIAGREFTYQIQAVLPKGRLHHGLWWSVAQGSNFEG